MKRRLELMPEVLPAPIKVDTNPGAVSPVRARTMQRLRALAAVGAAVSTGIVAACGGSTTGGSSSGGTSGGGSSGNGPDGGLPDGMGPGTDPGYGVVDPLPRPTCFEYANPPTATARYVVVSDAGTTADGGVPKYARLDVNLNQAGVAVGAIGTTPVTNATIVESGSTDTSVTVMLRQIDANAAFEAGVSIQTSCAKGPSTIVVGVDEAPDGGLETTVNFD